MPTVYPPQFFSLEFTEKIAPHELLAIPLPIGGYRLDSAPRAQFRLTQVGLAQSFRYRQRSNCTIYEMEKRGELPRRFNLTPRCVVWDLEEVEAWLEQRRRTYFEGRAKVVAGPDVHQRKTRPIKSPNDWTTKAIAPSPAR
jgi:predicted DNA-binding transcriptional regulator AlpA